ncbi:MAG: peptidoglycan DD-metalloendopeptidase family protein [Nitriliruptorales bacterium]
MFAHTSESGASRRAGTLLTVLAIVASSLALGQLTWTAPAHAAGSYEQVVSITFPTVAGAGFSNSYHAPRSGGRVHKATDIFGAKGSPLYAAVDGVICWMNAGSPGQLSGYAIAVCGEDGRRYRYMHLNNDRRGTDDGRGGPATAYAAGMRNGRRVARGQLIGYMGDSGNAETTPPHLHFEILDDGVTDAYGDHRINPYQSLRAARSRGDIPDGSAIYLDERDRVAGKDRIETSIALSRSAYQSAGQVVVVSTWSPSDGLVAGPLAAGLRAPMLLNPPARLDPRVAGEIRRLRAREVILVGGPLDEAIEGQLRQVGVQQVRWLTGGDRFSTAAVVAEEVWALGGGGSAPSEPTVDGERLGATADGAAGPRIQVSVNADRSDPRLLEGATVSGRVHVHVEGVDPDAVSAVAFHVDDVDTQEPDLHTEYLYPYDLAGTGGANGGASPWDSADLSPGSHTVTVVVRHHDGGVATTTASFTVASAAHGSPGSVEGSPVETGDSLALAVSAASDRSSPVRLDGARVGGRVRVFLSGVSGSGVEEVAFHVDDTAASGRPVNVERYQPYDLGGTRGDGGSGAWDTRDLANGTHTITAVVRRRGGGAVTTTATFTVRNVAERAAVLALGSHPTDPRRAWSESLTAGYYAGVLGVPVLLVSPT